MAYSLVLVALIARVLTANAEQCTPGVPATEPCTCDFNQCDVGFTCDPTKNHGTCTLAQSDHTKQCTPGVPVAVSCRCDLNQCDVGYICDPTKYHGTCTLAHHAIARAARVQRSSEQQCTPGVPAVESCTCDFNQCDVGYICDPTKYHGTCTLAGN